MMAIPTITDIKESMGADKVSAYLYDSTGGQSSDQILARCLNTANLMIKAFCLKYQQTFEDNEFVNEAVILYAQGEVYRYSNDELTGEDERYTAEQLIKNAWNIREDTTDLTATPSITVVQSKGRRRISDIDKWIDSDD